MEQFQKNLINKEVSKLAKPKLMGILNITPDSFSDGGRSFDTSNAVNNALKMVDDGADIIDIGGESTRPGAAEIPSEIEINRVLPVILELSSKCNIPISIDTKKTEVMKAALEAGASMVNDVSALEADGAIQIVKEYGVSVCLMHMKGMPENMQDNPHYEDVSSEVIDYLRYRADACISAGIEKEKIYIDPGFGFGKSTEHNYSLFADLKRFNEIGCKTLVGVSRKSMIGDILQKDVTERLYGSLALAALAVDKGAAIIRTHDVKETKDVIDIAYKVKISER